MWKGYSKEEGLSDGWTTSDILYISPEKQPYYEVEFVSSPSPLLQATGYAPSLNQYLNGKGTRRAVTVEVEVSTEHPIFKYSIGAENQLKLENIKTGVKGDIYCGGDSGQIINEGVTVEGQGVATGTIEGKEYFTEGVVEGEDAPKIEFPTLDVSYYVSQATTTISGDLIITDTTYFVDDVIYVQGNVKLSNSTLVGPGTIVAEGVILLENNSRCGTSKDTAVALFSNSTNDSETDPAIKLETSSDIYGVIFAPQGYIKIETSSNVYGSVVGGGGVGIKIETGGGVEFEDFTEIIDLSPSTPGVVFSVNSVGTWHEKYPL